MIHDEALADQPADRRAVLEQRVHPGIGMRVVRRRGAVDRVAAGVCGHRHHRLPVRQPPVERLQLLVVERLLPHDGGQGTDDVVVRDGPVGLDPGRRIGVGVAAESHQEVGHGAHEQFVLLGIALGHGFETCRPGGFERVRRPSQTLRLGVEERPQVGFGHPRDGPQDALLSAAGAGAVTRDQRVVVAPHHHQVSQRRRLRVGRVLVVVEPQELLRRVGQQVEERRASLSAMKSGVSRRATYFDAVSPLPAAITPSAASGEDG